MGLGVAVCTRHAVKVAHVAIILIMDTGSKLIFFVAGFLIIISLSALFYESLILEDFPIISGEAEL